MHKFIIVSFLGLGMAFYEMSGGADFVPQQLTEVAEADVQATSSDFPATNVAVSRSNAASLIALNPQVTTVSLDTTAPLTAEPAVVTLAATPQVEEAPAEPVVVAAATPLDIRAVAGSRVNMRQGPGTNFSVLDTLDGGTEAEVLEVNANGWARIQVLTTGQTGWMAERLLTDG